MKIEVINLYKDTYKTAYLINHKDGRKRVYLIGYDGSRKGMSYAAYLWENQNNIKVPKGYEVDHINNNKSDDRIENLQLLTKKENTLKERKLHPARYIERICPVCKKTFMFPQRNLSTHPNPCCSKECAYNKMRKNKNINTKNKTKKFKNKILFKIYIK